VGLEFEEAGGSRQLIEGGPTVRKRSSRNLECSRQKMVQDVATSRKVAMKGDRSDVRGPDRGCNCSAHQKASSPHSVE